MRKQIELLAGERFVADSGNPQTGVVLMRGARFEERPFPPIKGVKPIRVIYGKHFDAERVNGKVYATSDVREGR